MSKSNIEAIGDSVVEAIKGYINKHAISKTQALEQRVIALEERLRALDGQKAHIVSRPAPTSGR